MLICLIFIHFKFGQFIRARHFFGSKKSFIIVMLSCHHLKKSSIQTNYNLIKPLFPVISHHFSIGAFLFIVNNGQSISAHHFFDLIF